MNYFVIDTETTGIGPDDTPVEVAWIEVDSEGVEVCRRQSLIDPCREINPTASGTHFLTYDDVKDSPTLGEFFGVEDLRCYGRKLDADVVIGYRVEFDVRMLKGCFEKEPLQLDLLRWVRRLYPQMPDHKLSTCIFSLGLRRPEGAHRAMADVETTLSLLHHVMRMTGLSLSELVQQSQQPFEVSVMYFGKHKGLPMSDVPHGWLRWARQNMDGMDQDLRHTINKILE